MACAATAAPVSRAAAMVASINASLVQGRASWMATISVEFGETAAKPFQTESCRSLPPATKQNGFLSENFSASS